MITVRHAAPEDWDKLKEMHEHQGFSYALPEFNRPDWVVRAVLEEDGRPDMALLLRRTAEAYLLIGPNAGHGEERVGKILVLEKEATAVARMLQYRDMQAWLAPPIAENFG